VVKRAIKAVGVLGPIDLDVLKVKGQYYILEINPRFGGGYPHAYECGVNFLEYIVKNIKKKKNECFIGHYEQGNVALKYSDVLIRDRKDFVAICEK
jgi:carbamoyl-phosphate synthase large subunit